MLTRAFSDQFLGFLERLETGLLSWGFYDFSYSEDEIQSFIDNAAPAELRTQITELEEQGYSLGNVVEEFAFHNLLHRVQPNGSRFRTRFAEGIRLIARLRQMFRGADWATGPTLVSDIKVDLRHRFVPERPLSVDECWSDIAGSCSNPNFQRKVFQALAVDKDGNPLKFAAFQRDSFSRILGHYRQSGLGGTVVTAGTGAGKTKAFYVPAFIGMSGELDEPSFTKIIAVYPRNVLLADHLREAISEALKLRNTLSRNGNRSLVFGALLGSTLWSRYFQSGKASEFGWRRDRDGYIVPFLKSPVSPERDLVWRDEDRLAGRTCLFHADARSELVVPDGMMILERDRLRQSPPDVLFVSSEMLNRLMGDPSWDRTLGIKQGDHSPRLFLLDEVHAYEGLKGAQIAWVIRRWLYWSQVRNLHFIGLSATLREPDDHLSRLTGINRSRIVEHKPQPEHLRQEGHEYNLAVKGDASSGASLLATSIQTAMVLGRLLVPRSAAVTGQAFSAHDLYGSKVFGFSDNLDSINRWFFDVRNAENDRRLARFRLDPRERRPVEPEIPRNVLERMRQTGQLWECPKHLGYDLNQPLWISRCTSQDVGADSNSDLIIATSSLEVGYDDPEVGAILHHKHPRTLSSFIQRKGRAGRRVGTRPWTVTVLSDYGGDRLAFQNADRLFDPAIDHIFLPVLNPYVLRIQAGFFLLDWIGRQINDGEPFRYLSSPNPWNKRQQQRALQLLTNLLEQKAEWRTFRRDFLQAFSQRYGRSDLVLRTADVEAILWEEPRPLVLQVMPTLARKLEADWQFADPSLAGKVENEDSHTPIPEFLPQATFGDVGLSAVRIVTGARRGEETEDEDEELGVMPIQTALFEVCPGRVSKRFSSERTDPAFWLNHSDKLHDPSGPPLRVAQLYPGGILVDRIDEMPIYQPTIAELVGRPPEVQDSSNASWEWTSRISPVGTGFEISIFEKSDWADCVRDAHAFLHRDRCALDVKRYADTLSFETMYQRGRTATGKRTLGYADDDGAFNREAIGFRQSVDGLRLRVRSEHLNAVPKMSEEQLARARVDYFLHRIRASEELGRRVNSFAAERLWHTSVSMLVATALKNRFTLQEAQQELHNRPAAARKVIEKMSAAFDLEEGIQSKVAERVAALWEDLAIRTEIVGLEELLWGPLPAEFQRWIRARYAQTIGEAFRSAATSLVGELSEEDLVLDVFAEGPGDAEIFLSELNAGGLGHVESLIREIRRKPVRLHDAMRGAIETCGRAQLSSALNLILRHSLESPTGELGSAFALVRRAISFKQTGEAREALKRGLEEIRVAPTNGGRPPTLHGAGAIRDRGLLRFLFRVSPGWQQVFDTDFSVSCFGTGMVAFRGCDCYGQWRLDRKS